MRGSSWYSISCPASYQLFTILPDADAIGGSEVQLLVRLDAKRLVPGVHVADDVRPDRARRVRVGEQLLAKRGLAAVAAPHLRPPEIKALVRRQPIDDRGRSA